MKKYHPATSDSEYLRTVPKPNLAGSGKIALLVVDSQTTPHKRLDRQRSGLKEVPEGGIGTYQFGMGWKPMSKAN